MHHAMPAEAGGDDDTVFGSHDGMVVWRDAVVARSSELDRFLLQEPRSPMLDDGEEAVHDARIELGRIVGTVSFRRELFVVVADDDLIAVRSKMERGIGIDDEGPGGIDLTDRGEVKLMFLRLHGKVQPDATRPVTGGKHDMFSLDGAIVRLHRIPTNRFG